MLRTPGRMSSTWRRRRSSDAAPPSRRVADSSKTRLIVRTQRLSSIGRARPELIEPAERVVERVRRELFDPRDPSVADDQEEEEDDLDRASVDGRAGVPHERDAPMRVQPMDHETPNDGVGREIVQRPHDTQVRITALDPTEASRPVVDDDQVVGPEGERAVPVSDVAQVGHPGARAVHVGVRRRFACEVASVELGEGTIEIVEVEDNVAWTARAR